MLHSAQRLQKEGYEVTFIPVDREGQIDPEDIRRAIRPETGPVSIMFANNEIGTIYPIKEIRSHLPPGRGPLPHRCRTGSRTRKNQRKRNEY